MAQIEPRVVFSNFLKLPFFHSISTEKVVNQLKGEYVKHPVKHAPKLAVVRQTTRNAGLNMSAKKLDGYPRPHIIQSFFKEKMDVKTQRVIARNGLGVSIGNF